MFDRRKCISCQLQSTSGWDLRLNHWASLWWRLLCLTATGPFGLFQDRNGLDNGAKSVGGYGRGPRRTDSEMPKDESDGDSSARSERSFKFTVVHWEFVGAEDLHDVVMVGLAGSGPRVPIR